MRIPPKQDTVLSPPDGIPCFFCSARSAIVLTILLSILFVKYCNIAATRETESAADEPRPDPKGICESIVICKPDPISCCSQESVSPKTIAAKYSANGLSNKLLLVI